MEKLFNTKYFAVVLMLIAGSLLVFYERDPLDARDASVEERSENSSRRDMQATTHDAITEAVIQSPEQTNAPLMWGFYVGWQHNVIKAAEKLTPSYPDIYATSIHWGNERAFPWYVAEAISEPSNATLLIFWNPSDYRLSADAPEQAQYNFDAITSGAWDSYIESFLAEAAQFSGSVIIAPFEEVNLREVPWSCKNDPACQRRYRDAFAYLHTFFEAHDTVELAWVINHESVPKTALNSIESYYPGDAYVDIIGVNGFNFGSPYRDFDAVFGKVLTKLTEYNKPIYITSMASGGMEEKSKWIVSFTESEWFTNPQLRGWVWFNEDKERDWHIEQNTESHEDFLLLVEKSKNR